MTVLMAPPPQDADNELMLAVLTLSTAETLLVKQGDMESAHRVADLYAQVAQIRDDIRADHHQPRISAGAALHQLTEATAAGRAS